MIHEWQVVSPGRYNKRKLLYRPFIRDSLEYGSDLTLSQIERLIASREVLPIQIKRDNVLVGFMTVQKQGDLMHGQTICGTFEPGWADEFMHKFRLLGHMNGCRRLTLKGRKGWKRALAPLGFKEIDNDFLEVELWVLT